MTATNDVLDLVRRWTATEQQNDAGSLDGLLADDFVGVGPLGFVLTREQTSFRGGDNSGRFRLTLVAVRPADRWLVAGVHIGPLQAAPPTGG